ncbi:MAG: pilus assembly FimT family protein [Longimicrobiales bacterium]
MARSRQAGFTMIELLVVVFIGAVLMSIALPQFGAVQARRAAANARDAYIWLANRGRANAIERGEQILVSVDPTSARAVMLLPNGDTLELVDFIARYDARVVTSNGGVFDICYLPRGYALSTCSDAPGTVSFWVAGDTAAADVQALGHAEIP